MIGRLRLGLLVLTCLLSLPALATVRPERVVSLDLCMDRMLALHADAPALSATLATGGLAQP